MPFPTRPRLYIGIDLFPSAEIEIADTEIGASRQLNCLAKRGEKLLVDIVEDAGHEWMYPSGISAILRDTTAL
jgi:hypothetical protein